MDWSLVREKGNDGGLRGFSRAFTRGACGGERRRRGNRPDGEERSRRSEGRGQAGPKRRQAAIEGAFWTGCLQESGASPCKPPLLGSGAAMPRTGRERTQTRWRACVRPATRTDRETREAETRGTGRQAAASRIRRPPQKPISGLCL